MTRELYVRTSHPVRIILGDDSPPPAPVVVPPRRGKAPPGRTKLFRRIRRWMKANKVEVFSEALYRLSELGLDSLDAQAKESASK